MAQTDFVDGCGRPISHISPRIMQVKRVCTVRVVLKIPMLHFMRIKVDRRKRVTVMVEKEGRQHVTKRDREGERKSDSPQRTDHPLQRVEPGLTAKRNQGSAS